MQSKRAKGNAFQDWIEAWILKTFPGSSVHNLKPVAYAYEYFDKRKNKMEKAWRSQDNDLFNCIDLAVIVPDKLPIFIQATADTHVQRKLDDMMTVLWPLNHCTVQLWQKKDPRRVVVQRLCQNTQGKASQEALSGQTQPDPTLTLRKIGEIISRQWVANDFGEIFE